MATSDDKQWRSTREDWQAAKERLTYFLKELSDDSYSEELIAEVIMASGVILIDQIYGRDSLIRRLARLALKPPTRTSTLYRAREIFSEHGCGRRETNLHSPWPSHGVHEVGAPFGTPPLLRMGNKMKLTELVEAIGLL